MRTPRRTPAAEWEIEDMSRIAIHLMAGLMVLALGLTPCAAEAGKDGPWPLAKQKQLAADAGLNSYHRLTAMRAKLVAWIEMLLGGAATLNPTDSKAKAHG